MSLYTIGFKPSYDRFLLTAEPLFKAGRGPCDTNENVPLDYIGGIVFESVEAACRYLRQYRLEDFDVYVLDTTISNTYEANGYRHLIAGAEITGPAGG